MIISVEANTKKAETSLKGVEKSLGKVVKKEKEVKTEGKAMGDGFGAAMGPANALTGGLIGGFKGVVSGVRAGILGMKAFKISMISTGIGAIVVAVGALVVFFMKTKKGAEMLEVASAALGVVMGKLTDGVSFLGGLLVDLFNNPKESLIALGDMIKTNIMNRLNGVLELLPALGKAIGLVFEGKFVEAGRTAYDASAKAGLGIEGITGKVIGLGEELVNAVVAGAALSDQSIKLRESQRKLNVEFAEGRATIRELQLISKDETKTLKERSAAAEKASNIELRLAGERQRIAEERLRIHVQNMALTESLEADYDKQNELEVELIAIRQESARIQKALLMEQQILQSEASARRKARAKEAADAAKLKLTELKTLADALLSKDELELQKVNEQYDKLKAIAIKYGKDTVAIEEARTAALQTIQDKRDKVAQDAQAVVDEKIRKRQEEVRALLADEMMEEIRLSEIHFANLMQVTDADSDEMQALITRGLAAEADIRKKYADVAIATDRSVQDARVQMAQGALGALIALNKAFASDDEASAKKAFERNKALSMAGAVINTFQAVSGALAEPSIVPYERFVKAAAAGVMGVAQVVGISKTQFKSSTVPPPPDTTDLSDGGGLAAASQAPPSIDFGFLGQGAGGGIQAYVIAENVSNGLQAEQKLQDQTVL